MIRKVPEDARLEIKFIANATERHAVKYWLKLNKSAFYKPYPNRWVNNIYFDTYHYQAYNENLSGASSRTKLRYRWYGDSDSHDKGVLEVKCKRNYFGWKIRFPSKSTPELKHSSWQFIFKNLIEQLDSGAKIWLNANPHPVMINRYFREYYVSHDDRIRATIDTHQVVFDQRYKPCPNISKKNNTPDILVLEIKFDRKDRGLANQIIQGLPLRVSRNSKYMFAVNSMNGF
jgi:SPX domain protein involved in polyphosphate accumulation